MIISHESLRKSWFSLSSKAIDRKVNRELRRCKFRKKSFAKINFSGKRVSASDIGKLKERLMHADYYSTHVIERPNGDFTVLFDVNTGSREGSKSKMIKPREKLVAKAEKKRRKIQDRQRRKLRKSALRLVEKEIKKNVRHGSTYVWTDISLIQYEALSLPTILATMSEVVSIFENKGFNVTRHNTVTTVFDGTVYRIIIDLLEKPTKPLKRG
ncbi:hypothetical protein LD13_gp087 [Bacillus phage Bobb]|uniref:Uncharacterized protein n=1 Tax=Bacillus phage Bobb TaxID=1527469 RepID=A0A076G8S1_9CAUD|nr:hypothetical protein LD13_gp087 [Bacillus phage Bobb]AII27988.1 hypothetical protein [Bacillus phage Bobb]